MTAPGYSGRPQAAKLGLKSGHRVYLHHPPPGWALAEPLPELADASADGPPVGLVDVKVAAIDDNWSGLRVLWRLENRR